jgi:fucose 4-O-acetylase-like acetyltransferase
MERNYLLDNAKITLMFLVVFGHILELVDDSPIIRTLYLFVYSFHIPMFVLISGMLAKAELTKKAVFGQVSSLLIPLLVFELLYELLQFACYGELSHYTLNLQPYWLLWFLWSLFFWKLLLPVICCFRFPVLLSLIIATLAGYSSQTGYYLGISRTLNFLPFFVLGYTLTPVFFQYLQKFHRSIFIVIVLLAFSLFGYFNNLISVRWFYGSVSYTGLGMNEWYAGFFRLGVDIFSFLLGISVIALLPDKSLSITLYGGRSLYIYIWHGFFIKLISALALIKLMSEWGEIMTLIILLLLSCFITYILASERIASLTDKLLFVPVRKMILENDSK